MKKLQRVTALITVLVVTAIYSSRAVAQCGTWQSLGSGLSNISNSLTVHEGKIIAGGVSSFGAGTVRSWNGATWEFLDGGGSGTGFDDIVHAVAVFGNQINAGGRFITIGGQTRNRIARWSGSEWQNLDTGMNGPVFALIVFGGELIAAGDFTTAGTLPNGQPQPANRIARWNGLSWQPLGTGLNGGVSALTVQAGKLIVGGVFTTAGGVNANRIASWDPATSTWQSIGGGMNDTVTALTVYNNNLIAGGLFSVAGGSAVNRIARWDGLAWHALSTGMNSSVRALTVYNTELIACGNFTIAGGLTANHVARWNGSLWQPLGGPGMNGSDVRALVGYNAELIAAGDFTTAGGQNANYVARYLNCSLPQACPPDITQNGVVNSDDLQMVINAWGPCPALPTLCPADIVPPGGNGAVNVDDLLAVINAWGNCPAAATGACWLPNNTCTVNSQAQCTAAGGTGWVQAASCVDSDGDRIPNAFEKNDCSAPAMAFVGTNPNDADTDGDSLRDGDEFYGTTAGLNLPALGCSPLRKNLIMEVDWFDDAEGGTEHSHRPTAAAVNSLVAAFANSPVTNVCGANGVTLIVDYGQGGAFTEGNLIPGGDTLIIFDSEFNSYKANHFAPNRHGHVYYAIHAHRYNQANNTSTGFAEFRGDDHVVTLLADFNDSDISKTMMHELGHNLGLRHGGDVETNWKPNYNSVMNYRYSFPGIDNNCDAVGDGVLNYSIGTRIDLNENALLEMNGVCAEGATAIDWNQNRVSELKPYARNIKCRAGVSHECGATSENCCSSECLAECQDLIKDYNDWANIVFSGLFEVDFAPPEIIYCNPPR